MGKNICQTPKSPRSSADDSSFFRLNEFDLILDLNRAGLEGTNLLGAELSTTRLEQVDWGRHLSQELRAGGAKREGRMDVAIDLYLETEEIYRNLTKITEQRGHFNQAGNFYHKEKIMRRMQMRRWSKIWCWSKLVDLLCGYGEAVDRVIIFSLLVMLGWAGIFFLLGVKGLDGPLVFTLTQVGATI